MLNKQLENAEGLAECWWGSGSKNVPVLIPGTCAYVSLHGKGDFEVELN